MAFADTAELIIALNLRGNAERGIRNINSAIDNLTRNATVRGGLGQISQGLGIGLRNSAIIGAAGVAALATQVRAGVESLRELENANVQTAAALESTEGVSGQTVASIRALSEEYETLGGVLDDKIIQAGANVLLTFRRIDEEAFEPALLAALDLSTALGTDLQPAILQVGKALEDPIAGVTALRRAGVQFTEAQQDQIKALIEANDLYGAQQVVLEELSVQVGGRFAAAGRTNEASVARMGDAWEDLQQTLTRGLLPGIDAVSRRLSTIFADPAVIARVEDFGERLAGFLNEENLDRAQDAIRDTFGYLASIPWGAIGDGLRIAGQAATVAVNAFKSLPPGVQNALITLLAANKLTGGLVATGLGQLAAVALGALKTIVAGNVTVIGKTVVGGPGGGPAGPTRGGGKLPFLPFGLGPLFTALAVGELAGQSNNATAEMNNRQLELQREINEGAINSAEAARLWSKAYGEITANPFRVEVEPLGPARPRRLGARDQSLFPNFSEARNADRLSSSVRTFVDAIGDLSTDISGLSLEQRRFQEALERLSGFTDKGPLGPPQPGKGGNFVPTVKLDPSQVSDLREPTRLAAEKLRMLQADAAAADTANRTASNFLATEAIKNRMETSARLTMLAGKYDQTNAHLAGVAGKLDAANSKLAAINAKNFSPTIKVENKTSNTVIQNNITQNATVSGFYRDANVR